MSNTTELLQKLKNIQKLFETQYNAFMATCFTKHATNMENTAEMKNVVDILKKYYYETPKLIEKLANAKDASVYSSECNLLLYESIYQDNNDMLLSYTKIENDDYLKETYLDNGADVAAFAITTAQYWISQYEC